MDESILSSIKKLLGMQEEYTHFDTDIVMHINSVFMILEQLGVGPSGGFYIEDDTAIWDDYLDGNYGLEAIKSYIYMKVKLAFDPPQSSTHIEALNRMISELEWRLHVSVDPSDEES